MALCVLSSMGFRSAGGEGFAGGVGSKSDALVLNRCRLPSVCISEGQRNEPKHFGLREPPTACLGLEWALPLSGHGRFAACLARFIPEGPGAASE